MIYNGYKLISNVNMVTRTVLPPIKVQKSWLDAVIEWNPCNVEFIKPDYIYETKVELSKEIFVMENEKTMVMHPIVFRTLTSELMLQKTNTDTLSWGAMRA